VPHDLTCFVVIRTNFSILAIDQSLQSILAGVSIASLGTWLWSGGFLTSREVAAEESRLLRQAAVVSNLRRDSAVSKAVDEQTSIDKPACLPHCEFEALVYLMMKQDCETCRSNPYPPVFIRLCLDFGEQRLGLSVRRL
jgi:hypothetical protein